MTYITCLGNSMKTPIQSRRYGTLIFLLQKLKNSDAERFQILVVLRLPTFGPNFDTLSPSYAATLGELKMWPHKRGGRW